MVLTQSRKFSGPFQFHAWSPIPTSMCGEVSTPSPQGYASLWSFADPQGWGGRPWLNLSWAGKCPMTYKKQLGKNEHLRVSQKNHFCCFGHFFQNFRLDPAKKGLAVLAPPMGGAVVAGLGHIGPGCISTSHFSIQKSQLPPYS